MPFDSCAFWRPNPPALPLSHLLGALSLALDLTEGQPPGHCLRACWIAVQIGRQLRLPDPEIQNLYYAVLLKDLGCSSNAARIVQLYATDDLRFKRDSKILGDAKGPALRFILEHTAAGATLVERLRKTWRAVRDARDIVQELVQTRCERGAAIARQLRFDGSVAHAIHCLDEHWDGNGRPGHLQGAAIPLFSRIALLAQIADVFRSSAGPAAAEAEVTRRTGTWFDPEIAAAFHAAAHPRFWKTLAAPDLDQAVLDLEPGQRLIAADDTYLDDIAIAFAQVVDAKSPFTRRHSERVATIADRLAAGLGLDPVERRALRRAALLHDVGKLGISNAILDKPAKLTDHEWHQVRLHPVHSQRILSRIACFAELAEIGGNHHERLDGKGYPRGLRAPEISLATRIVSIADVCDALTAARPYRDAMPIDASLALIRRDVGTAHDPACYEALTHLATTNSLLDPPPS